MCGLFGAYSREKPIEHAVVARGLEALRHRGPDGEGVFFSPDARVALGHVRLAVIDRETGAQPIENETGDVVAIVNGELYDFERQRRELEARGHRFRTRSDSELVVHLWEEHGEGMLAHLRGEFALILWDARDRTLLAARDPFGVRPLVFTTHEGTLWLASEAKALFAIGVPARWDHASFHQAAQMQYPLPDRTMFRDVRQLAPGERLRARGSTLEIARYVDLDYPREGERRERDERDEHDELADATNFRAVLEEATRLRLRADVPIAFQLSGGIDSTAVAALGARASGAPIDAFTLSFTDDADGYDESTIAEESARFFGARWHPVRATAQQLAGAFVTAVRHGEGLAINGHLAAKLLLARAVRAAGFRVVLTGEGADEVLAGYAHLRQDLLGVGGDRRLLDDNRASAGLMLPDGEGLPLDAVRARLGFVPTFLAAKATLGRRLEPLLSAQHRRAFAGVDAFAVFLDAPSLDVEGQLRGRHVVDQSLYLWSKTALAGYILRTLGDGMEMASGIEGRLPFLDPLVFKHVRALPIDLKIRDGVEKHVLREAMRGLVPERVRVRQKHPFLAPPNRHLDELLHDRLRSASFATLPFFDARAMRALLDDVPTMTAAERRVLEPVLMLALTTSILGETFGLAT